jgi:hypothetical protein
MTEQSADVYNTSKMNRKYIVLSQAEINCSVMRFLFKDDPSYDQFDK